MFKRWLIAILGCLLVVITACTADDSFEDAYTARGEAERPSDLEKSGTFSPTENLQVVVKFKDHSEDVRVKIEWIDPAGEVVGTLERTAPSDTEYMNVSFDLARAGRAYWEPGEWKAEISIENKSVKTLEFTVAGEIPEIDNASPFGA